MAINYEWNCKTWDVYPEYEDEEDVVYMIHWRLTATSSETDGEDVPYTAGAYGTEALTLNNLSEDFIPFADLTNTIITDWVKVRLDEMGEDAVQKLKDNLASNIAEQITPTLEIKTID